MGEVPGPDRDVISCEQCGRSIPRNPFEDVKPTRGFVAMRRASTKCECGITYVDIRGLKEATVEFIEVNVSVR